MNGRTPGDRVLDAFDRILGPVLHRYAHCRFTWRPGPVVRPRFVLRVNEHADCPPEISPAVAIKVARAGLWRWRVDVPTTWRECSRWPEISGELDYHLCDLEGRYPPSYLVHHCGTTANLYGSLRWELVAPATLPKWHESGPLY